MTQTLEAQQSTSGLFMDYEAFKQGYNSVLTPEAPKEIDIRGYNFFIQKEKIQSRLEILNKQGLWTLFYNFGLHTDPIVQKLLTYNEDDKFFKTHERELFDTLMTPLNQLNLFKTSEDLVNHLEELAHNYMHDHPNTSSVSEVILFFTNLLNKLAKNETYHFEDIYEQIEGSSSILGSIVRFKNTANSIVTGVQNRALDWNQACRHLKSLLSADKQLRVLQMSDRTNLVLNTLTDIKAKLDDLVSEIDLMDNSYINFNRFLDTFIEHVRNDPRKKKELVEA